MIRLANLNTKFSLRMSCSLCIGWLEDAAYFAAIDNTLNSYSWFEWPEPLKNRHLSAMEAIYESQREFVRFLWLLLTPLDLISL